MNENKSNLFSFSIDIVAYWLNQDTESRGGAGVAWEFPSTEASQTFLHHRENHEMPTLRIHWMELSSGIAMGRFLREEFRQGFETYTLRRYDLESAEQGKRRKWQSRQPPGHCRCSWDPSAGMEASCYEVKSGKGERLAGARPWKILNVGLRSVAFVL